MIGCRLRRGCFLLRIHLVYGQRWLPGPFQEQQLEAFRALSIPREWLAMHTTPLQTVRMYIQARVRIFGAAYYTLTHVLRLYHTHLAQHVPLHCCRSGPVQAERDCRQGGE